MAGRNEKVLGQVLDGRAIAGKILNDLKRQVEELTARHKRQPFLLSVQVGMHSAADLFARSQKRAADSLGIGYRLERLSPDVDQMRLLQRIHEWNRDPNITGVTIQFPLPPAIDARTVSAALDPKKDVEGIHPQHIGQAMFGWSRIGTCTSRAIM